MGFQIPLRIWKYFGSNYVLEFLRIPIMQRSYKPRFHRLYAPPLWLRGNIIASHLADPGSILGPINFLGLNF